MNDDLEHLWGKLSLTKVEQTEVVLDVKWLEEVKKVERNCLVGKLVLNRRFNPEVMKNVLSSIWKLSYGMSIREVGCRLFIFHFDDNLEKERVLMRQPWSFNKSLLVLGNFAGHEKPEDVNLQWCPFWVQIHGLPIGLMTVKIATVLGESIGDVEEVDADREKMAWGRYIRVRVAINISKSLKRGTRIAVERKGSMLVVFKYEKLANFCYVYGCLDHQELECDDVIRIKKGGGIARREYGP